MIIRERSPGDEEALEAVALETHRLRRLPKIPSEGLAILHYRPRRTRCLGRH